MNRILFVDDEQALLDGLKNSLWKQRQRWEMIFALGGEAALAELAKKPADVIVSDMRMPDMDGATLLERVKKTYPDVVRIVLSGHSDREATLKIVSIAQQFLSKPCETRELLATLERACRLKELLSGNELRKYIGSLDRLPSVPRTYRELASALIQSDVASSAIAKIIARDPAMAVKVLQLVNSSFFGPGRPITSIEDAVSLIGVELLGGLTLIANVFATTEGGAVRGLNLERLQDRSLLTATIARRFLTTPKQESAAFTAGLLLDIGKILLLWLSDRFADAVPRAREGAVPLHAVEMEVAGVTHPQIAAYLLGLWGLPLQIVEAVAYHLEPRAAPPGDHKVLAAVHVAHALVDAGEGDLQAPASEDAIDLAFLEGAGLLEELERWRKIAEEQMRADVERTGGAAAGAVAPGG